MVLSGRWGHRGVSCCWWKGWRRQQASAVKGEAMGPSKAVAFDQSGQPTRAAIGFAAGQGVPVETLEVRQTPKGDYLFAVKRRRASCACGADAGLAAIIGEVVVP